MRLRSYLSLALATVLLVLAASCLSGCSSNPLRFAPSGEQKQLAWHTHQAATAIEKTGTDPHSQAAKQVKTGTAASLAYTGIPENPQITDFNTTAEKAISDAIARPDVNDITGAVDEGLSLAAELAILFGVGGAAVGGKKVKDWIALARAKARGFEETVAGNELLKDILDQIGDSRAIAAFKNSQNASQRPETKKLVASARVDTGPPDSAKSKVLASAAQPQKTDPSKLHNNN